MHSFSWWRMVGRVMECKGGAPLTNEIKIFKHCFTILPGPHTLSLLPILATWSRPASTWHDSCVITHAQHLSQWRQSPDTWRKYPCTTLLQYLTPQLIILSPIITLRTSKTPILLTARLCARLYLFPLFIVTTLIPPLTISFCTHHVTMKDVGFKSPQFTAPSQPIGLLESIMVDQALCDW